MSAPAAMRTAPCGPGQRACMSIDRSTIDPVHGGGAVDRPGGTARRATPTRSHDRSDFNVDAAPHERAIIMSLSNVCSSPVVIDELNAGQF